VGAIGADEETFLEVVSILIYRESEGMAAITT